MTAELVRDSRAVADVGRRARLELVFSTRAGRTVLGDAYAEPPFRVGRVFTEGEGLHMIMASSAPGVFGGDALEQVVRLEAGARVRLTSQSALQIHPAASPGDEEAQILSTYNVADSAALECHWDPLIPFAGARFTQRIAINVDGSGSIYWSDAFMRGRLDEPWRFERLSHELRVSRDSILAYLERYRLAPRTDPVRAPWIAGECSYFGTTLALGSRFARLDADHLHRHLATMDGLQSAVDNAGDNLVVTRLMSPSGPAFHEARTWLRDACGSRV